MESVRVYDVSLRDGNHAVAHSLSPEQIKTYAKEADDAGLYAIEVGHGNGLGASSFHLGFSHSSDEKLLTAARSVLKKTNLAVHVIPGYAKLNDIDMAISCGVDIFRIASHCTEADTSKRYIDHLNARGLSATGVLMMSHMLGPESLSEEAKKLEGYGCHEVIIMDSAGAMLPKDVSLRIEAIKNKTSLNVGFHAHNNLGLATGNVISAIESGATIIDGSIKGFGAGAGNAQIENIVAILNKNNLTNIQLEKIAELCSIAEIKMIKSLPFPKVENIISALNGVFSGFDKKVSQEARKHSVSAFRIWEELGRRNVIAGQEDIISEVAISLKGTK